MSSEIAAYLTKKDKTLGRLIKQAGPITLKPQKKQSPYESLVESVVYQQLTGKAAATIFSRLKALFPGEVFPSPEAILKASEKKLRTSGLSRAKAAAIKDIAAKAIDKTIPSSRIIKAMDDQDIITRLTSIRGVGPWTVEMFLIFTLGRSDVLPVTDYGIRKGFALAYRKEELPTPKELLQYGERWKPYRTTAAWYLWRALDLAKTP